MAIGTSSAVLDTTVPAGQYHVTGPDRIGSSVDQMIDAGDG
jgi:hypothetical protein